MVITRKLEKKEEAEFKRLTTHHIGLFYDDIDNSFAQNILNAHNKGFDPIGYWTKNKTIWVAEINNQMAGFLVATEKRGGSVKLLPEVIKPEYQKQGIGTQLWKEVEDIYKKKGYRKVYNDGPLHRVDLLQWVISMGLNLEAHLKEQYRKGQDEYVAGKLLRKSNVVEVPKTEWHGSERPFSIRDYQDSDKEELKYLILREMPKMYNEIDDDFIQSIILAEKRFGKDAFKEKGKKIFVVDSKEEVIGCCIATPKRGGAVKLVPFLIDPEFANNKVADSLLFKVESVLGAYGYRKLYTLLPLPDINSLHIFKKHGFEIEGLIREPYKENVDNLFFGKRLVL